MQPTEAAEAYPQGSGDEPPLVIPDLTCPDGYIPNSFKGDLARGWGYFEEVINAPQEMFQDLGEKAGCARYSYARPNQLPGELETMKGVSFFPSVTPLDIFSCIYNPGYRLIWDQRINTAAILQRYAQTEFLFYLIIRGIGPIYWPRDYVGVQGCKFYKKNGDVVTDHIPAECESIDLIWTSVDNSPVKPQAGKVRAKMNLAAYRIQSRGNGCEVTFLLSIMLSVDIPAYLRRMLKAEVPLSLPRLRDAIPTFGVCPYIIDEQCCLVIQRHFWDAESRKSHVRASAVKAGTFVIVLDTKRMYPSGIMMPTIDGPGAQSVSVQEAITGDRLFVHVSESGIDQDWILHFEPRDKEPEPDQSGGWW
ncbi:unnamed protein product [Parajaminaea phylloscopi]